MRIMSQYDEIQQRFEARALPLFEEHRDEVKRTYKLDAETPQEQRERHYMAQIWPKYERRWTQAAQDFVAETATLQNRLEARVFGKPDGSHLIGLASVPSEKLSEVLDAATATGDAALQRSVIAVARQRGERGLVNRWVSQDQGRAAAAEELKAIPELERLEPIALGRRPPKAAPESLSPDPEAIEKQVSREAADVATRSAFFNRPRSIVGARTTYLPNRG
jgi:hypothetical protein